MMSLYPGKMGTKCLFMSSLNAFETTTISLERSDFSTWGDVLESNKKSTYITDNNKIKIKEKKKPKPSNLILKLVGNL